jgi:hypothetical protein
MGDFGEAFKAAVMAVVKNWVKPSTIAKVESVNKVNNTCNVIETGTKYKITNVRLLSVEDSFETQLAVYPKVGSLVSVAYLFASRNKAIVIKYSEIDEIALRGDQFGGLVKVESVQQNLDELKSYVLAMKSAVSTALLAIDSTIPGTGLPSGTAGKNSFNTSMTTESIDFVAMENEKIKHG